MGRKKKDLRYVQKLLGNLSPTELKSLKQYLSCFDPNFNDEHRVKTLVLLDKLLQTNNPDPKGEVCEALYPDKSNPNLKFLRLRLQSKIYESLLLEVNVERKGGYSKYARANIEVRKKLIQAQILWGRNITDELMVLLQQIIRKSTKYEFYPELLEALYLKQQFQGFRDGLTIYNKIQQEIELYEERLSILRKAKHYFTQIVLSGASKSGGSLPEGFLKQALEEIGEHYDRIKAPSLGYYFLMLELEYHQQREDFSAGSQTCKHLIGLLKLNSHSFPVRRMGIVYGQLANNELLQGNFIAAIQHGQISQKYFKQGSINDSLAREVIFYGHYHQQDFKAAQQTLSPLLKHPDTCQTETQFQRRCYLYAATLFQMKKFKDAETWLQKTSTLLADKSGWNLGIRLLNIMILMEMERYDEIELAIDALRKHITNLKKRNLAPERFVRITHILNRIRSSNFDFQKAVLNCQEDLALLQSGEEPCKWVHKGPELVRFDPWLLAKAGVKEPFWA